MASSLEMEVYPSGVTSALFQIVFLRSIFVLLMLAIRGFRQRILTDRKSVV